MQREAQAWLWDQDLVAEFLALLKHERQVA
jgi:hypothetical protein